MGKNIVFFADGTWSTLDQKAPTNVAKMFNATTQVDPASGNAGQVKMYDAGVGTDGNPVDWLAGGVSGAGLQDKIKDGYTFIATNYQPGDQIYIFGFSRGAYTARSLADMIAVCGLPDHYKVSNQSVSDAFAAYRTRVNRGGQLADLAAKYGNNTDGNGNASNIEIAMVGVWDTVGALGIPDSLFATLDKALFGFLDTSLHADVKVARHALSIDECRPEFAPTLWQPNGTSSLKQIWFPGGHSDVGGGVPNTELSDIALKWMMLEAKAYGVQFDDALYDYHTSVQFTPSRARVYLAPWPTVQVRTVPADVVLANDVAMMVGNYPPPYHPVNLAYQPATAQSPLALASSYGTEVVA
jgi:uncharacterized protein (DUF2235 family)